MGFQTLTDTCKMPFGKYKDTPMQDVPVDYLHFLWHKLDFKNKTKHNSVAEYIEKSLSVLKSENEDLIW